MTRHFTRKRNRRYGYYVCGKHQKEGAAACLGSRVSAGELESFVIGQIRRIGRDPALLEATLEADQREHETKRPELLADHRRMASERGRLEGERANLVDAIAGGSDAAPALGRRLREIDKEQAVVQEREAEVRAELEALDGGALDPDEVGDGLADLEPIWDELFPAERARVLTLLLERVEFDAAEGEVAITFRPGGPEAQNEAEEGRG